jgi:hypothetical protein
MYTFYIHIHTAELLGRTHTHTHTHSESIASDVGKFVTEYTDYYERNKTPEHKMLDPGSHFTR